MRNLNKYHCLIIISSIIFISLSIINFGKNEQNVADYSVYPMQVIDNEIRVGDTVLYRFIPVDGGEMMFANPIQHEESYNGHTVKHNSVSAEIKYIPSFLIGETPVTDDLFIYVMEDTLINNPMASISIRYANVSIDTWKAFLEKLEQKTGRKFALPTSYQWEYAARGGQKSKGYKYAGSNNIDEVAWYKNNTPEGILFKGKSKKPNELGLFDMSGGVLELTSSTFFDLYPYFRQLESSMGGKQGNPTCLMARGGNWSADSTTCETRYVGTQIMANTGVRLILEY